MALALGAAKVVYVDDDESGCESPRSWARRRVEGAPPDRIGPFPITVNASLTHEGLALRDPLDRARWSLHVRGFVDGAPDADAAVRDVHERDRVPDRPRDGQAADPAGARAGRGGQPAPRRVTSKVVGWDDAADAVPEPETKLIVTR